MEELEALIKACVTDATLATKLLADIKAKEIVVRSKEQQKQFETNFLEQNRDNLTKEEKQAMRIRIEDDIKAAIPGFKQNSSEPYHEFMKRGFKSLQDKITALTNENQTLQAAKAGDADSIWKQKYETLETQSKQALAAKDTELATLKETTVKQERQNKLTAEYGDLKKDFITELPSYFTEFEKMTLDSVLNTSAIINGELVLTDEKGNPVKDGNLNNIKVMDRLKEKFKDIIKPTVEQPGTGNKGAQGKQPPNPAGTGGKSGPIPAEVDTQAKLTEYLGKKGLLQGSKEFDEAFSAGVKERNITKIF